MALSIDQLERRGQEEVSAKCAIEIAIGNACPVAQNPFEARDNCLHCIPRIEQSREYQPERPRIFRFSVVHEICGERTDLMFISRGDLLSPQPLRINVEGRWETYCNHCRTHFPVNPTPLEDLFPGFNDWQKNTQRAMQLTFDLHCIRATRPAIKGAVTDSRQKAIEFYMNHTRGNPLEEEAVEVVDKKVGELKEMSINDHKIEAKILAELIGLERQTRQQWGRWQEENDERFPKPERKSNKPPLPTTPKISKTLYP